MYYSVAGNAGFGQTPYSFVGRGFTPAVFRFKISLRREQGLACGLGHARSLTPHCGVIQDPRAALLPRPTIYPIITQIGRENKFSAEIYVSRTVEDAGPYNFGLAKHPYEKLGKSSYFLLYQFFNECIGAGILPPRAIKSAQE